MTKLPAEVFLRIAYENRLPKFLEDKIREWARTRADEMQPVELLFLRGLLREIANLLDTHHDDAPEASSARQMVSTVLSATNDRGYKIEQSVESQVSVADIIAENQMLKRRVAELEAQDVETSAYPKIKPFTLPSSSVDTRRFIGRKKMPFTTKSHEHLSRLLRNTLPLTFAEYQQRARDTAVYKTSIFEGLDIPDDASRLARLLKLTYTVMGLAGEVGEFANIVKKIERDGHSIETKLAELVDELGDVFWYVFACADEIGVSAEDIARYNIEKLAKRKRDKALQDNGNR